MCCFVHAPSKVVGADVFGFVYPHREASWNNAEVNWIHLNNVANIASYFVSPLVGIARIVMNTYFLCKGRDVNGGPFDAGERCYLKIQIGRGVFELMGGGHLLWVVDLCAFFGPYLADRMLSL